MLDANLKTQLKAYLERLQKPLELVATLDDSKAAGEVKSLLADIAALSDKITVVEGNDLNVRKPSFPDHQPRRGQPACALPACLWAMNSPPWCWPCCGRRRPPIQRKRPTCWSKSKPLMRHFNFEAYYFAGLPQLPRCGAGAVPDGRP